MAAVSAIASLISLPIWGWMFSLLWGWFVTPTFPAVPAVTVQQATGLLLIWAALEYKLGSSKHTDEEYVYRAFETFTAPLIILALSWPFAHFFVGTA